MNDPFRAYFLKNRESLFPDIKDFSQDFMKLRLEKNVNKLKWGEWFWFHPSAFKIIWYGSLVLPMVLFLTVGIVFIDTVLVPVVSFPIVGLCVWELIRKYRIRHSYKFQTFYDTFVKD